MFGKREPRASDRFYVLLLSGNAAQLRMMEPILALSVAEMERAAIAIADDGEGGMVVTSDDPASLKAKYVALGFKVVTVAMPRRRPNETAQMVVMDLRLTGEYRKMRQELL